MYSGAASEVIDSESFVYISCVLGILIYLLAISIDFVGVPVFLAHLLEIFIFTITFSAISLLCILVILFAMDEL